VDLMAGIYEFNAKALEAELKEFGLRKTWLRILVTHLSDKIQFEYILSNPKFKGIKKRESDLIADLSIGDVSVLYEYSVAIADSESRKSNGQFFTPDDVAIYMAEQSQAFGDGVWLDPCSGIGNLSWHLTAIQENPEDFLFNRMILSDRDELALLIARTLFTVSFQKKRKRLFEEIETNFVSFDFLSVADSGSLELFETTTQLSEIPAHDFVIVNPPYLATDIDGRFETAKAGDLYAYFLENIIKTSRGFISITPQSFTNAGKFASLRKLLLDNFENLTIYTFDNVPANIFKGIKFGSKNSNQANSIRASIVIAREGKGKRRITSLIRWRSSERETLFKSLEKFLSDVPLTDSYFPKVSKDYKKLYMWVKDFGTLGDMCSSKTTKYSLHVPSAPRYFIPALKKPVQRASQKTLYFRSSEDRDYAYLLINSSFMYWWWRVRDGGMTLSLETITSLPLLDFEVDPKIVAALEKSEKTNKVYKQNAGAAQENVKHPKDLMKRLNQSVIPDYADLLITLHENSELSE
jgi:hypothetical protein